MSTAARARTSLLGTSPAEALTAFEEQDRREERGDDSHVDVDKMQRQRQRQDYKIGPQESVYKPCAESTRRAAVDSQRSLRWGTRRLMEPV